MTFFARPNLDDTQFKQLEGTILTISGQTQIASTSGLTLIGDIGFIPIIATGATDNYVLTYDSGENVIKLKEATASGGTGVYSYDESSTCTVGGLNAGSCLCNEPISDILQCILVPTLDPNLTNPSISCFTLNPTTLIYEVGTNVNITGTVNFNPGEINPQYPPTVCDCRSDGTQCYVYQIKGLPAECITNSPSNSYPFGVVNITDGSNDFSAVVCYCGGTQPYDSSGNIYDSPLTEGNTSASQINVCGLYPWYWGIESSGGAASGVNRPTTACIKTLINGGFANKCVDTSNGTLYIEFNSSTDDYLWFATPCASITKTCWYVDALNNAGIGGGVSSGGNLFPDFESVTGIGSTNPVWSGQEYKVYVSNYQSSSSIMELRNS